MRIKRDKCPLTPPGSSEPCPLKAGQGAPNRSEQPSVIVVRTERRSWITVAITGFGALLLRYLKTVRERARTVRNGRPDPQASNKGRAPASRPARKHEH